MNVTLDIMLVSIDGRIWLMPDYHAPHPPQGFMVPLKNRRSHKEDPIKRSDFNFVAEYKLVHWDGQLAVYEELKQWP